MTQSKIKPITADFQRYSYMSLLYLIACEFVYNLLHAELYVLYPPHWFSLKLGALFIGLPTISGVYALLLLPLKNQRRSLLSALLLIWEIYVLHDLYFWIFKYPPLFNDLLHIGELGRIMSKTSFTLLLIAAALPLFFWFSMWDFPRLSYQKITWSYRPLKNIHFWAVIWLISWLGLFTFCPLKTTQFLNKHLKKSKVDIHLEAIGKQGRIFYALRRQNERQIFVQQLAASSQDFTYPPLLPNIKPRNVYLLVLESFFNPATCKRFTFSKSPIAEELQALVQDNFNISFSPTFAGNTAKAEFEILCGVPSFSLGDNVEFYAFTGAPVDCLPRLLSMQKNYYSILGFPGPAGFFNSRNAYKSMGFQELHFKDSSEPPGFTLKNPFLKPFFPVFDGELFKQMRAYQKQLPVPLKDRPQLFYILTEYGHSPFIINQQEQKLVITVTPYHEQLTKIANITYHRTAALAQLLRELQQSDPTALVVAIGDHFPAFFYQDLDYQGEILGKDQRAIYETMLLIMDRGKFIKLPQPVRHFNVFGIILDRLSDGDFCRTYPERCTMDLQNFTIEKTSEEKFLPLYKHLLRQAYTAPYSKIFFDYSKTYNNKHKR